jgi:NAD(P)-dependent dehydrogenase (short-subunit alcohol dehydrogenase family)
MVDTALIVGAGTGISASFARLLAGDGTRIALAARDTAKLAELARETKASTHQCDATSPAAVERLFADIDKLFPRLDLVLFNASARARGPLTELVPADVLNALTVSAYAGFLVAQAAARRMLKHKAGAIFFTGASASVKGYPQSAPFAMGKFALRGLAQAAARELQPHGIHIAHFVIDGGVRNEARGRVEETDAPPDSLLDPDAIAETYMHVLKQPRSAWSLEVELRPWVERF